MMNSKKSNGYRQDQAEQMLISYSGAMMESQSEDSDHVQPLDLPPTKMRRPRSRKRNNPKIRDCCSLWNFCQIFFIVFILATTVSVVWFTLILKNSMETMKTRITQLESFDRSTSKEYAELQKSMDVKIDKLQHNEDGIASLDKSHFLSLLKQIAFLNRTVDYLNKKVKSPQSAVEINRDIELLKNGMADMSQEITQVKDQVAQLKKLAHSQNSDLAEMKNNIWNLSVQVGHLTGQPVPTPPKGPSTPPLILRVPIQSDMSRKKQDDSEMFKNLTTRLGSEIGHVRGLMTAINGSLASRINLLEAKMEGLVTSIRDHMVQVDELSKEMESVKNSPNSNGTDIRFPIKLEHNKGEEMHNLSVVYSRMLHDVGMHGQQLSLLMSQVTAMNNSIHHRGTSENNGERTAAACNCSGVLQDVKRMLDADEKKLDSLKAALEQLKQKSPVEPEGESQSTRSMAEISLTTPPSTTAVRSIQSISPSPSSDNSSKQTLNASEAVEVNAENEESDEEELEGPVPTFPSSKSNETGSLERATTEALPRNGTENAERSTDALQTPDTARTELPPEASLMKSPREENEEEEEDETELEAL